MELQLLLSLSLSLSLSNKSNNNDKMTMMSTTKEMKKRYYSKAFDDIDEEEVNSSDVVPKTLSLFTWKPNGEDNSDNPPHHHHLSTYLNKIDSEKGVIGWPPIHRWRKKMCYNNNSNENYLGGDMFINNYDIRVENGGGGNRDRIGRNGKSMYVKVKMDGVGIARKIDLTAHHSFNTLTHSLILMFPKRDERHKLIYEDKDGAWLLAGDESWGSFVETVQRLKLVKNGDKI